MAETVEQIIRRVAQEVGVDPELAVAVARQESGLNPRAHNPNGEDSWGLFQGNRSGGMGSGYSPDQLMDPEFNARLMLSAMATTQQRTGLTGGQLAAASQRPADPVGYARSVNAMLSGGRGLPHTGSPFSPNAQGGAPVASNTTTAAQKRVADAKAAYARLNAERARVLAADDPDEDANARAERYAGSDYQEWTTGTTLKPKLDARGNVTGYEEIASPKVKQWEAAKKDLDDAEQELAKAQDTDLKAGSTPGANDPKGTKTTKRETLGDGKTYAVSYVADGLGNWNVDTDTPPQLFGPQKDERGTVAKDAIDLETARINLERAKLLLTRETDPTEQRKRQVELDTAELALRRALATAEREEGPTAQRLREIELAKGELALETGQVGLETSQLTLQRLQRPEVVNAPATQEFIVTRQTDGSFKSEPNPAYKAPRPDIINAPSTQRSLVQQDQAGNVSTVDNPAYEQPAPAAIADPAAQYQQQVTFLQAQAKQELHRLVGLQRDGVISQPEAKSQFDQYWVTRVQAPLEGLRMAAENDRAKQQRLQEEQQRKENIRVEDLNRERTKYGYERGELDRSAAMKIIPEIRSPGMLGNMAAQISRWGQGDFSGVEWKPETFQLQPGQVPNLNNIASQGAARALAHISPAAAQQMKSPLPDVSALPQIPDIRALLPTS